MSVGPIPPVSRLRGLVLSPLHQCLTTLTVPLLHPPVGELASHPQGSRQGMAKDVTTCEACASDEGRPSPKGEHLPPDGGAPDVDVQGSQWQADGRSRDGGNPGGLPGWIGTWEPLYACQAVEPG